MPEDLLDVLVAMRERRRPFAVATVIETAGSVSAKTGAKAVIDEQGRIIAGWVGGGCAESAACETALDCMARGETRIIEIDLNDEILGAGMPCGGSMRVYVEPVLPKPVLWLMGHGRIAECLCALGAMMGLEAVVNDPLATAGRYPQAARLVTCDPDYAQLQPQPRDFVVIATQHKGDHESLARALASGVGYIALIASRKRARLVLDHLVGAGFDEAQLRRIRSPAGLDLGARTPEEIALSVMSEIVLERRQGSGMPLTLSRQEKAEYLRTGSGS